MSSQNGQLNGTAPRPSFAATRAVHDYPDFLDVQLKSFHDFVQDDIPPEEREDTGLQAVFNEHFPIQDSRERYTLEFIEFGLDPSKHSVEECIAQGLTYSVPLKAKLRLSSKEEDEDEEAQEAIEQEVYLGNLPFMTERGTFIVNGAERVVVSQLHRSPGVFFGSNVHSNGTLLFSARVIPFRGSWIEFSTDVSGVLWAYIDRKKKLPVTTLLRALGYSSNEELVNIFELAEDAPTNTKRKFKKIIGRTLAASVTQERTTEIVDEDTGEVIEERTERVVVLPAEHELEEDDYEDLKEAGIKNVFLVKEEGDEEEDRLDKTLLLNTLKKDPTHSKDEALKHVYLQLRGSEAPDISTAQGVLDRLFFSERRYDLGTVGRYRINNRLKLDVPMDTMTLTSDDVIAIVRQMVTLQNGKSTTDDIDHLSNRRVRTVGEQLGSQFSLGLARMARTIKERMNLRDADSFTPQDLVNARTVSSVINTFFGTNQLSQFMDQTNPLAELTHKRRMSALGPGGLTRERAGFEVRDVHYTHYGRLCPIETPEGPNIGLISSLCVHAKINDFGFIETPYRVVEDGKLTDEIAFLTAAEEDEAVIAQANAPVNEEASEFASDRVKCRFRGDFPIVEPDEVQFMDVAPNQIVSPAASLIPFLEHDDANRALMGSNMQRQAVPLLRPEAPLVGTGLEARAARDSRAVLTADGPGVVEYVDSNKIVIRYDEEEEAAELAFEEPTKEFKLTKFRRTNQDTCINQRPIVKKGDRVEKHTVLTEGFATENGELALGKNVLCAFMPWRGYNFEDAIAISERLVADDVYTSVHIEEFELQVRDTKRGEEELTREIPNVSEEATKDLDERGIIRVGARVEPGDIIVGKITPKGETDPTPEEKLLRAIFGDKAGDVKDASLKAPPGMSGIVIDTKLFSRRKLDPESKKEEQKHLEVIEEEHEEQLEKLSDRFYEKFFKIAGKEKSTGVENKQGVVILSEGAKFTEEAFADIDPSELTLRQTFTDDDTTNEKLRTLINNYRRIRRRIEGEYKQRQHQVQMGDELPAGIVQLAKVYVAKKRRIQVGDKMAGRHGNKGVIAKVVPQEDMPFLEDGTPVDICLNPLGVPSRMNLGQIYETLLGWAGKKMGTNFATPIFDGATMDAISDKLEEAGLPRDGRIQLYDGHTGQPFDEKTTVGYIYMLKLSHLVEDKIHARSIGPYSLITQQPLGGKAQFGGQRLGEMEVWALYAYGASYNLQEMLTYKSDDVQGRSKAYECIVKGENMPDPGTPESFNVLVRELQGLGLEVKMN